MSGLPEERAAKLSRRRFMASLAVASAAAVGVDGGTTAAARAGVAVPEAVPLPLPYDLDGVSYDSDRSAGDFDGHGWAFPAEELPSGLTRIAGVPFEFPTFTPGADNFLAARGQTLDVPEGSHALLYLIGAASGGSVNATARVRYADGGTDSVPLRFTDWAHLPQFLEAVAVETTHRHRPAGDAGPRVRLFLQVVPFDPARQAVSLTLPDNPALKLIAASAQPAVAGSAVKVTSVASTELFTGSERSPRQLVHITVANIGTRPLTSRAPAIVTLTGDDISVPEPVTVTDLPPGHQDTIEVGIVYASPQTEGTVLRARVHARTPDVRDTQSVRITAAEPGWTMYMVSHYHYDPVWWNTQGAYTESWENSGFQRPGLALVRAHLDMARRDPDYKFVLAELDYLKPFWDSHPEDRDYVRQLLREGRLEFVGGLYNEPNTNLTSMELTIRSAVYGVGYQRDVLGGPPRSTWQLDVFGHDPQFPGIMADAGLTSSSWARGPHHEWGPKSSVGDNRRMQFRSEFDWIAPSGRSLLTSYMPNHYSAGWWMDTAKDLPTAVAATYELFRDLKSVAATKNCLLPVGTDYSPPNRWVTRIHRSWADRYVWPKFVTAVPSEFFDAVRRDLARDQAALSPQTRDMNPIFTGKDISFIDTKQAQRQAENTLLSAERFATIAALLGARYPVEAMDKAWRQLCFGAHHDAITGSECDQVYLDLLGGWREALELGRTALDSAQALIAAHADTSGPGTPVLVFNAMAWPRTDAARSTVDFPAPGPVGIALLDSHGRSVPVHVEHLTRHPDGTLASAALAFVAHDVPATGYATYHVIASNIPLDGPSWNRSDELAIENEYYHLAVDPERGGAITALYDKKADKQMLRPGGFANELLAYDEYEDGPGAPSGGPWVTVPKGGPVAASSAYPATVSVERCPIGQRITVSADFALCRYTQEIMLWNGVDRVDLTTRIDGFTGSNRLMRVRFQPAVEGGMPVSEVGDAVVGRGFGFPNVDYAEAKWTLEYPAYNWVELGSTLVVALVNAAGRGPVRAARAVSVAEVVVPGITDYAEPARDAVTALVATGVTATTSTHDGSRYGSLDVDSNLPDVRISVGGPVENDFTAAVLDAAPPAYQAELDRQLAQGRTARVWVPADKPLAEAWLPRADLRGPRALPVLVIAGRTPADTRTALHGLAAELRRAPRIDVVQPDELDGTTGQVEPYGFAVLNRGLPGFTIDNSGDIYLGILRSSTGWPSGTWIDPPRRTLPDGANFETNHWSHTFAYALVGHRGDWRSAGLARRGHAYNNPFTTRQEAVHRGPLGAAADFLSADGDGVVVTALKPHGNPMASMAGTDMDPAAGIVLRAYESTGRPTTARFRFFRPLDSAATANPLEQDVRPMARSGHGITAELGAFEIRTMVATPREPAEGPRGVPPGADRPQLAPSAEPAQPVFARYWRHNKGAASMGYRMTSIEAEPTAVIGHGPYDITITVASSHTVEQVTGMVEVIVPDGWTATPATRMYALAPGAHLRYSFRVQPNGPGGRYFVAVRIADGRGQIHEDVVTVDHVLAARAAASPVRTVLPGSDPTEPVQDSAAERALSLSIDKITRKARLVVPEHPEQWTSAAELEATLAAQDLVVSPGQTGHLSVALRNTAHSQIHGEAQLITPYAIWPISGPWSQPFSVPAGGDSEVSFDINAPAGARPGNWWALVKLMYFGRLLYTPAASVIISSSAQTPAPRQSADSDKGRSPIQGHTAGSPS
ncbi:glycoside hydrolase family 38 N-terminal domain-containing protein [Streptomyces sp. NPDC054933]